MPNPTPALQTPSTPVYSAPIAYHVNPSIEETNEAGPPLIGETLLTWQPVRPQPNGPGDRYSQPIAVCEARRNSVFLKSCQLYDDGTKGDEKAGDGIYIGYFGQTLLEGDYRVIVRAKGRSFERASNAQTFSVKGEPSVEVAVDKENYTKNEPIQISAKMLIPTIAIKVKSRLKDYEVLNI